MIETLKTILNYGVPTAILGYGMYLAPKIADKFVDALDKNTEEMSRNTVILSVIAVKLGCSEEMIKQLTERKSQRAKTTEETTGRPEVYCHTP